MSYELLIISIVILEYPVCFLMSGSVAYIALLVFLVGISQFHSAVHATISFHRFVLFSTSTLSCSVQATMPYTNKLQGNTYKFFLKSTIKTYLLFYWRNKIFSVPFCIDIKQRDTRRIAYYLFYSFCSINFLLFFLYSRKPL